MMTARKQVEKPCVSVNCSSSSALVYPYYLITSWNHNDLGPDEAGLDLLLALEPSCLGGSLAVGEVGGHPGGVHNVVQVELGHSGVQLQQQRERLSNTWGGDMSDIIK